jgi:hypothetical protein
MLVDSIRGPEPRPTHRARRGSHGHFLLFGALYASFAADCRLQTADCRLQTADYARAIIKAIAPKMDPEILQQRVEVRLRRQELPEGANRPHYRVLLDEAVLHRPVGGPTTITAQLDKVLEAANYGKATVQVIPFEVGAHAAADGYFILLEFNEPSLSPVVFLESLTGIQYLERKTEIARYREAIEYLRDSALNPRDSLSLIAEHRRTYVGK